MRKKLSALLLALVMCLGLLPLPAAAAETNLPDWYFLFAIFKNVDADGKDKDGKDVHAKYSMTQDEVDAAWNSAKQFEAYMNQVGVMRAHVDVVEVDETLTELYNSDSRGSYITREQAAPLLEKMVDLDQYDHVTCIVSLNINTSYLGLGGMFYENGTGHACINTRNREYCLKYFSSTATDWPPSTYLHEFMHFMEEMNKKWGAAFNLHRIQSDIYTDNSQIRNELRKPYYDNIILNQVEGNAETGTGVYPAAWQYPPHVMRTMTEWTVPSGVTSIGEWAFQGCEALARVSIPASVTEIGTCAFYNCMNLNELILAPGVTSIGRAAFRECSALTRVTIPASVTNIGEIAFWDTGVTDVYYGGTEAQWNAIQMGEYNEKLTRANVHYNHLMADVRTTDWFAKPVTWAVEKGVTSGTGEGKFSPNSTCTQGQVLTFLWRAYGSPEPSGKVSGSEYYAVPLQWAVEQKLVDGSLSANRPCTRADVVTYLWKLAGSPSAKAASFSDVSSGAAYAPAVSWAVEQGVTGGTSETTFSPEKACTRGQIVTFLYAALGK